MPARPKSAENPEKNTTARKPTTPGKTPGNKPSRAGAATRQPLGDGASASNAGPEVAMSTSGQNRDLEDHWPDEMQKIRDENAQLKKMREENEKLKKELAARANNSEKRAGTTPVRVPRPVGPVSKWSLQTEMGLDGSVKKKKMYESIQRAVRTAIDSSGMDWSLSWNQIPPSEKVNMFATVRSKIDGMDRYVQDWATEGLARQLMKNRRTYAYRKGHLEVPEKFSHLKANAAQRSDAPRGKRKATVQAVKATPAKRAKIAKGKGKAKAMASDDDEEEEGEGEGTGNEEDDDGW